MSCKRRSWKISGRARGQREALLTIINAGHPKWIPTRIVHDCAVIMGHFSRAMHPTSSISGSLCQMADEGLVRRWHLPEKARAKFRCRVMWRSA